MKGDGRRVMNNIMNIFDVGLDGAIDMILKFIELKEKNMGKDI